jgi:hypothetical protein
MADLRAAGAASASVGSAIAAVLGTACCTGPMLGPLIVTVLGASGAATLAGIKPYTPYVLLLSFALLLLAFWSTKHQSQRCEAGAVEPPAPRIWSRGVMLWIAGFVWLGSCCVAIVTWMAAR